MSAKCSAYANENIEMDTLKKARHTIKCVALRPKLGTNKK